MTTALIWIEIKLLAREPLTLVVSLLFPVVLMLLLLASFGSEPDEVFTGLGGTDFYVPSYLGAAIAVMGFAGIPTRLASYRLEGVLRRFRAAGVPASSLLASQVVMTAVLSVAGAAVMLALAYTGFDVAPPVSPLGDGARLRRRRRRLRCPWAVPGFDDLHRPGRPGSRAAAVLRHLLPGGGRPATIAAPRCAQHGRRVHPHRSAGRRHPLTLDGRRQRRDGTGGPDSHRPDHRHGGPQTPGSPRPWLSRLSAPALVAF